MHIQRYFACNGQLSATEIDNMPFNDFQLFLLCRNAHNVAMDLQNKSNSSKNLVVNKQKYLEGAE